MFITDAWYIVLAAIVVGIIEGFMDRLNFKKEHNTGYFSLTYPIKKFVGSDFWHDSKKLAIAIILGLVSYLKYGFTFEALYLFLLLASINLILHETILHFKE